VRKIRLFILVLLAIGLLVVGVFLILNYFKPRPAGIFIETSPASTVFINGEDMGKTPFRETRSVGEIVLKLVPESFQTPLTPYEVKVNLSSGVETVVRWNFGESQETSSGELISFEKTTEDKAGLTIVTIPDSAKLVIDGSEEFITPQKLDNYPAGEHALFFSVQGYDEKNVRVKTHAGYKLTAVVQLAKGDNSLQTSVRETVEEDLPDKEFVEILPNQVGFLRAREAPGTTNLEVGRVVPGKNYELIETDEDTGWFKIKFEDKEGWVSSQYAKKVVEEGDNGPNTSSPTPTQ